MKYFGTAGIRGRTNVEINALIAYRLGRAVGSLTQKVVVARDTRKGSEMLLNAVISGVLETGAEVLNCGIVPLSVAANYTKSNKCMGIMVTGSHIPPYMNGLVVFREDGSDITRKEEEKIEKIMDSDLKGEEWINIKESSFCFHEAIEEYTKLLEKFAPEDRWKIVVDPANGTIAKVLPVYSEFFDIISVNSHPNYIPPRKPEPRRETIGYLTHIVRKAGARFAVGTDMDGDRGVFLDDKGRGVSEDVIGAFFAEKLLGEGDKMVTPVNSSMLIEEVSKKIGFDIHYCPIGPPEMAEAVRATGAKYSYEETGKYMFPPHTLWGDAMLTALYLLKNLDTCPLSQIVERYPKYYQIKGGVECENSIKRKVMDVVSENIDKFGEMGDIKDVITIDGIKIIYGDSWLLIRPSGTEPLIRIFSDSRSEEKARKLVDFGMNFVSEIMKKIHKNM